MKRIIQGQKAFIPNGRWCSCTAGCSATRSWTGRAPSACSHPPRAGSEELPCRACQRESPERVTPTRLTTLTCWRRPAGDPARRHHRAVPTSPPSPVIVRDFAWMMTGRTVGDRNLGNWLPSREQQPARTEILRQRNPPTTELCPGPAQRTPRCQDTLSGGRPAVPGRATRCADPGRGVRLGLPDA